MSFSSSAPVESIMRSSSGVFGILVGCDPAAMMADWNVIVLVEPSLLVIDISQSLLNISVVKFLYSIYFQIKFIYKFLEILIRYMHLFDHHQKRRLSLGTPCLYPGRLMLRVTNHIQLVYLLIHPEIAHINLDP